MATVSLAWRESLGRITILLTGFVLATSMLDLFVNRLLFRAGPEVLSDVSFPGIADTAVIGRISFTFEQFVLYLIMGGAAFMLFHERRALARNLGFLMFPQLVCAALLYLPLSASEAWQASMLLVLLTAAEVFGLIYLKATSNGDLTKKELLGSRFFQVSLAVAFFLPLYTRVSVLLVGINFPNLPGEFSAYVAATYMIVVASVAAFVYSLSVVSPGYKMGLRRFAKSAILPTLLVIPILAGLLDSFFMTQIMSMVIAMSTDIIGDFQMVRILTAGWWFLMMAVFVLWFKGRGSKDWFFFQQGVGLVFILSMTFLFNYPNYLLLGTAGVLLLSYPLLPKRQDA